MTLKSIAVVFGLILSISVAKAEDAKSKRNPADIPRPVGLPKPHGSGMPPGAVGLPVPQDSSCRRAAGMAAVHEALMDNDNVGDCSVHAIKVIKADSKYRVDVVCSDDDNNTEDSLDAFDVTTKIKNKKTKACRVLKVQQDRE